MYNESEQIGRCDQCGRDNVVIATIDTKGRARCAGCTETKPAPRKGGAKH